jgi:S-adenosyl-L-methionine hydrolase (adenosine-forming)
MLTDFGLRDHYAGVMKGVIASIAPEARVIDLTHGVPAQSVAAGAIALAQSWRYFPRGTIFLAVVDPGVGAARRAIAVETRAGARMVGPDNGLLSLAARQAQVKRVVELKAARFRLTRVSSTFHGRDVFAPAAAHLWMGAPLESFGPRRAAIEKLEPDRPTRHRNRLAGSVIYVDGFGNLVTNIDRPSVGRLRASFPGRRLLVTIEGGAAIRIVDTYAAVPAGAPLATFGSFELLEIAVRDASAAEFFGAGEAARVTVSVSA